MKQEAQNYRATGPLKDMGKGGGGRTIRWFFMILILFLSSPKILQKNCSLASFF
jgi:hypothetical protein